MLWLISIVVIILILLVAFYYSYSDEERFIRKVKKRIKLIGKKRKIAERRFLKREISKSLFDALDDALQTEQTQQELLVVKMKFDEASLVEENITKLISHVDTPTKRIRSEIKPLAREITALEKELEFLEKRLLRRRINKRVFEKIAKEKQLELIQKEAELFEILQQTPN